MPQPKPSSAKVSMPTFSTLEAWTRSQVQELIAIGIGRGSHARVGTSSLPTAGVAGCTQWLPQWAWKTA